MVLSWSEGQRTRQLSDLQKDIKPETAGVTDIVADFSPSIFFMSWSFCRFAEFYPRTTLAISVFCVCLPESNQGGRRFKSECVYNSGTICDVSTMNSGTMPMTYWVTER
mmetsp:Transcript_8061/g.12620  ORF Transcript_8061/g.12620 Transcript_8061/m.12620 type:complete len:109 (-) Transcript_8061:154-480(-)